MDNENSSIFKPYQKYECWRGEKQTILKTSIGRQLPYIVNFKKNACQIFDIEWERITHSFVFPEGCNLIDVDYFPTKEGQLGIIVGVEDQRQSWGAENFVVALAVNSETPTMKVTHSAEVPTRITVVKTLFSSADMSEEANRNVLKLYHRLMSWQHVIAIGCKDTQCHLARLTPVNSSTGIVIPIHNERKNLINLMAPFTSGSILQYTLDDGSYREYPTGAVYISALSLMPRSRTLLVGLSMGGILAASLNPSNQMMFLELRHERLIRKIAPLEPEDDPDKFEYFIAAVDSSPRHPIMIQLWRGSFKTLEEVDDDVKYDRPYFNVCLEHKILFGEKWLSVNSIVTEREHLTTTRKRGTDESMLNVSQSFGATSNRNSVLLTYERKKMIIGTDNPNSEPVYIVEAAIFDIDAWYYKRVPGRVSTDGTILQQCAFLSTIKSDIQSEDVNDIGILTLNATDVSRFSSMISDADQLFYPSALSYERVFVVSNSKVEWMKIQNIQDTIINKCAAKLPFLIKSPESVSKIILAAGLVRKNILSGSPNSSAAEINYTQLSSDQKILLNLIVYYGKVNEFCGIATRADISEILKKEIAEWAIHEAVDYKRTISDKMVSLFQGRSFALSPIAENAVTQGFKLFRVIYEYLKTCSKILKSSRLHNLAHSVKCIRNHTKLTSQFIIFDIIPVNHQRLERMKDMHSNKMIKAIRNSSTLPIQSVIRNMNRLAPNAQFWNDVSHNEWYPPTPLDLLESLLNVTISERIKRELVIQYIIDWIRSSQEEIQFTEKQLALETIKIMTNQLLEVDLEKIYFVLDQEKKALNDKKTSEEVKALGEKVFSMQNEELSYDKLWGGNIPMAATISKHDMERFEKRMKMQMEGGKSRLPVLDPESEMLYQVYLFENEKFEAMSSEAVKSNKLLSMFLPGMIQKRVRVHTKSPKEREIEKSVKTMFERQLLRDEEEMKDLFASVTDKNERKRRTSQFEEDGDESISSSAQFVPPTAKRIQQWKKTIEPMTIVNSPVNDNSSITSLTSSDDPNQNAEINMLIATPARYYKRPLNSNDMEDDLLSPTANNCPPVNAQNSILKTAKAVQSANRGRIRFHESVPRGADESVEEKEKVSKGLTLNFAILEDEEEEETMTTRKSKTIEIQEEEDEDEEGENEDEQMVNEVEEEKEDECVEHEKTFEDQEEFEVFEDKAAPEEAMDVLETAENPEETFELQENDAVPPIDETYELSQKQICEPEEKKQECQDEEEEEEKEEEERAGDGVQRSVEIQSDEDCESAQEENVKQHPDGLETESGAGIEKNIKLQEETTCFGKSVERECAELPKKPENLKDLEVLSESRKCNDDPVDSTFEIQEESEQGPLQSIGTDKQNEQELIETEPSVEERPPSRNTRSSSIQKASAATEEAEDDSRPPSRRTRSSSIKREDTVMESEEQLTPRSTRTSSRRSASKALTNSELFDSLFAKDESKTTSKSKVKGKVSTEEASTSHTGSLTRRSRSRAQSEEIQKTTEPPSTPKRGRPRKGSLNAQPSDSRKRQSPGPDETETPTKRPRGRPRLTPLKAIPEIEDLPSTSSTRDDSAPSTPRRGRPPKKIALESVNEDEGKEKEDTTVNESQLRRSTRRSQHQ